MSKRAEERALEALPPRYRKSKYGTTKIDSVLPVRKLYIRAYEQAEKDLALTWKDICNLEEIINQVHYENPNGIGAESFGEEVLRKFNKTKEK